MGFGFRFDSFVLVILFRVFVFFCALWDGGVCKFSFIYVYVCSLCVGRVRVSERELCVYASVYVCECVCMSVCVCASVCIYV